MGQSHVFRYPIVQEKLLLVIGVIVCATLAIYLWRPGMSPIRIWSVVFLMYFAMRNLSTLVIYVFAGPESLTLEGDSLTYYTPIRNVQLIEAKHITTIRSIWWMDFVCNFNIFIESNQGSRQRIFLKANLIGLGSFLRELRNINPDIDVKGRSLQIELDRI